METLTSFEDDERRPACASEDAGISTVTLTKSSSHASSALDLVGLKDPSLWTLALLKVYYEQHGLKKSGKKQNLLTR